MTLAQIKYLLDELRLIIERSDLSPEALECIAEKITDIKNLIYEENFANTKIQYMTYTEEINMLAKIIEPTYSSMTATEKLDVQRRASKDYSYDQRQELLRSTGKINHSSSKQLVIFA